ncbi:helix-turn-helix domain-containing protein [Pseudosporangium ferrugineum]|uniref:helix-turn-helix domain-containing protein n=1 Tax=Pseudosporangium ferrugineum TaxID=439699 RepID=UPI0011B1EC06|nr:helix-turn-helix transcriptional regulator [Pseudosporangium ferrugineum]
MTFSDRLDHPHAARCAARLRAQAPQQGWSLRELAQAITGHCGHSRLRAYRFPRGWSLTQVIDQMVTVAGVGQRLVASRVSRWERGEERPSSAYLDGLCRVYGTGPVDLGFAADYSDAADGHRPPALDSSRSLVSGTDSQDVARHGTHLVASRGDQIRRRVDEALSGSTLSDSTVAHKEAVAAQYGRTYKTQPATVFLDNILADLDDLQILTDRKLPAGQRRDLCAVTARLAGLVSMTMVNLAQYRHAREWVHTARLAADEAGDPLLRAWVASRSAVASLHLGDPYAAMMAAREAELLTRNHRAPITAMAWAILARAAATTADAHTARAALRHAEDLYGAVEQMPDNTAYAFTAGQLHFYRSHALTTLGESRAAWQAQDDAISAFGPDEHLDPNLVRLDRALCMVHNGDIVQGADYAATVLQQLPAVHRPAIVWRRAQAVAYAIPAARRSTPRVRALHEVLAIGAGPAQ